MWRQSSSRWRCSAGTARCRRTSTRSTAWVPRWSSGWAPTPCAPTGIGATSGAARFGRAIERLRPSGLVVAVEQPGDGLGVAREALQLEAVALGHLLAVIAVGTVGHHSGQLVQVAQLAHHHLADEH